MTQKTSSKKIVVGYGRVSSAEQTSSGYSLEMQKELCKNKATAQGYSFVYFEDPGKTGSNTDRKGHKSNVKVCKRT